MEVVVPDLGDFADVEVIEVLVKPGDSVAAEQGLITLETEKATMDVPSSAAGRIAEMKVRKGGKVSQGTVIALVEAAEGAPAAAHRVPAATTRDADVEETARQPNVVPEATVPRVPPAVAAEATARPPTEMLPAELADLSRAHASPSVRMFARELGVDLTRVSGSGQKGRITHADVKAFIKRVMTEGAPATGGGYPRNARVEVAR